MKDYKDMTFGDFVKDLDITDDLDKSIEHINDEEYVKRRLISCMEEDIQQYLPDIADIWGDDNVRVEIKDGNTFVVGKGHYMPIADFYKCVYENGGVVEPKDFERY